MSMEEVRWKAVFPGIEVTSSILQCKFPPFSAKSVHPSVNLPLGPPMPRLAQPCVICQMKCPSSSGYGSKGNSDMLWYKKRQNEFIQVRSPALQSRFQGGQHPSD